MYQNNIRTDYKSIDPKFFCCKGVCNVKDCFICINKQYCPNCVHNREENHAICLNCYDSYYESHPICTTQDCNLYNQCNKCFILFYGNTEYDTKYNLR
jgi:hypothetical protein